MIERKDAKNLKMCDNDQEIVCDGRTPLFKVDSEEVVREIERLKTVNAKSKNVFLFKGENDVKK